MEVTIKYHDSDALTAEEVVQQAQKAYGPRTVVEVRADSLAPHDQIYFALQQILTLKQLEYFYTSRESYAEKISALRREVIVELSELVDAVIIDNETRITP